MITATSELVAVSPLVLWGNVASVANKAADFRRPPARRAARRLLQGRREGKCL